MSKLLKSESDDKLDLGYLFWCVGCKEYHAYTVKSKTHKTLWTFNNDLENPTFTPSLLCRWTGVDDKEKRCHLFITNGKIIYCSDCTHELAGQTVDLPDAGAWKSQEDT